MPVPQNIILKGVVASQYLDMNGEMLISVQTAPHSAIATSPDEYKFEPYFSVTLRAADLGNPPVGATVDVEVRLS